MLSRGNQTPRGAPEIPGVIDAIGLAFTRLLARPWVILGPVLLDLYLWLGLRVTAGPLVLKLADLVEPVDEIGDSLASALEGQRDYNLAELLSLQLFTVRVPTFVPLLVSDSVVRPDGWNFELSGGAWWLTLALGALFAAAGFVIGAAYLQYLGDVAMNREPQLDPRATLQAGWRLALWLAMAAGLLLLIVWPVLVAQAGLIVAGGGLSGFLLFLPVFPAGIGFVLFFFSVHAIVLDRATATEAFRASYRVVRAYGGQSLGFIASYMIVTGGVPFMGRLLIDEPPGTMIAIIGNAFVSTGMIAAGMIYYDNRAAVLAPQAQPGRLRPGSASL